MILTTKWWCHRQSVTSPPLLITSAPDTIYAATNIEPLFTPTSLSSSSPPSAKVIIRTVVLIFSLIPNVTVITSLTTSTCPNALAVTSYTSVEQFSLLNINT